MDDRKEKTKLATFLSGIYVVFALCLLLGVCRHCYPDISQRMKNMVGGREESPVRQAFDMLTEGLEAGKPMKETFTASFEVLFGETG